MKPFAGRRNKRLAFRTGPELAMVAKKHFVERKRLLLETFRGDAGAATGILVVLENYFARQMLNYLRNPGATAAAWQEHGPERELQEVRDAVKGIEAWNALVAKYRRPAGGAA